MNIVLFGFKNCGKSTLGKLLSEKLQWQFIDIDQLVTARYEKEEKRILPAYKIYEYSEVAFRLLEREAIDNLAGTRSAVIATGGGSVLDHANVAVLQRLGKLVYLKANKETIKERMFAGRLPAFIDADNPEASFAAMYQSREKSYSSIAGVTVEMAEKSNQEIIAEILAELDYGK